MFVASDTRSVELAAVLSVPPLCLELCVRTGFRRGEMEPDCDGTTPLLRDPRRRKS